jgi:hypothetical protein
LLYEKVIRYLAGLRESVQERRRRVPVGHRGKLDTLDAA